MTIEETRKLGIEFERRVQTMIPDTETVDKLDTETIYSYLNQYLDKYVHDIYRNLDSILSGTNLKSHIDSVLQSLLKTVTIQITDDKLATGEVSQHLGAITDSNDVPIVDTARSIRYTVPKDYYLYVRSVSQVRGTYSFKASGDANTAGNLPIRIVPNQLVSQNDIWKLLETPHDSLRILRYPAAMITEDTKTFNIGMLNKFKGFVSDEETNFVEHDPDKLPESFTDATADEYVYFDLEHGFVVQQSNGWGVIDGDCSTISLLAYMPEDTASSTNIDYVCTDPQNAGILTVRNTEVTTNTIRLTRFYFYPMEDVLNGTVARLVSSIKQLPTITVLYDQYTSPTGIKVTYYKQPSHFSLMTSTPCELPMDSFEELVSGAVDLYVQYVAGAEARKRLMEEARRQAAKEQEANAARRGKNGE